MHQAVEHSHQHRYGQEFDVPGIPEARPVGQQEDTGQPDEPAAPDGNPCRVQDHVRVGQGAPVVTRFCTAPMPAFSKPGLLPVQSHHLGCALTLPINYLPMAAQSRSVTH